MAKNKMDAVSCRMLGCRLRSGCRLRGSLLDEDIDISKRLEQIQDISVGGCNLCFFFWGGGGGILTVKKFYPIAFQESDTFYQENQHFVMKRGEPLVPLVYIHT